MESVYSTINSKSIPVAQESLGYVLPEYCTAVWSLGNWKPSVHYYTLLEKLKLHGDKGVVYDINGKEGCLHWTLFQTQTFPVEPVSNERILEDGYTIKDILGHSPSISLTFKGISKTRFGLFLCGYSATNINGIRDTIRKRITDIKEPHPQDIYHSTLFRYTKRLENTEFEDEQHWLTDLVNEYADKDILEFIPARWEYGFGTWRQIESERKVLLSWAAHPRWILHRGLMYGPDKRMENNEDMLRKRIEDGWNVEIDIWYVDAKLMLGHDGPTVELRDETLLEHRNTWVHCKNLDAAAYCNTKPNIHFFVHDTDMAVLTSKGYIWCYPGNKAGPTSVCVLPELVGITDTSDVSAVCSDYLPIVFYKD